MIYAPPQPQTHTHASPSLHAAASCVRNWPRSRAGDTCRKVTPSPLSVTEDSDLAVETWVFLWLFLRKFFLPWKRARTFFPWRWAEKLLPVRSEPAWGANPWSSSGQRDGKVLGTGDMGLPEQPGLDVLVALILVFCDPVTLVCASSSCCCFVL